MNVLRCIRVRPRNIAGLCAAVLMAFTVSAPATAQRGAGVGRSMPDIVARLDRVNSRPDVTERVNRQLPEVALQRGLGVSAEARGLAAARRESQGALVSANRTILDTDKSGWAIIRSEVIAVDPSQASLSLARAAGFTVARETVLDGLDLPIAVLAAPAGMSTRRALAQLRKRDPKGSYDFNHVYVASGQTGVVTALPQNDATFGPVRVGLIDTGLAETDGRIARPDLRIEQRAFTAGGVAAQEHGLLVASVLLNQIPDSRSPTSQHTLYAADVYGALPGGGSAEACARALGWMVQNRVPVINVSLVGPQNQLLEAAVRVLLAKGHLIVAPVGNEGPSAKPLYPASYPGVIAVTATGANGKLLPEAGRATHVEFSAPGVVSTLAAANGAAIARGTSFAAPVVSGQLSRLIDQPDVAAAKRAVARLSADAVDVGKPGRDELYGYGLVSGRTR